VYLLYTGAGGDGIFPLMFSFHNHIRHKAKKLIQGKTTFCFAGKRVWQALLEAKTLRTTKSHVCCLTSIGRSKRFNNCFPLKKGKKHPETAISH